MRLASLGDHNVGRGPMGVVWEGRSRLTKMRLVLALVLCWALVLGVVACADETTTTTGAGTTPSAPTSTAASTTTSATAPADSWTELHPAGGPPSSRMGASMVYDSAGRKMILFGGAGRDNDPVNDMWAHDPMANTWTELHPTGTGPSTRLGQCMVYDSSAGRVILFGGAKTDASGVGASLNDTWTYDPVADAWIELHPTGTLPPERYCHCMVYDSDSGKVILFGGQTSGGTGTGGGGIALDDTWTYDPTANTWAEVHPTGIVPPGIYRASMVYDSGRKRAILFGAADTTPVIAGTWAYDPVANAWTELHPTGAVPAAGSAPLLPRWGHSMVYDPVGGKVILFGGFGDPPGTYDEGGLLNDTWAYDPAANTWTQLQPTDTVPPARLGQCMVYDPVGGQVILFGGRGDSEEVGSDTWSYRPGP